MGNFIEHNREITSNIKANAKSGKEDEKGAIILPKFQKIDGIWTVSAFNDREIIYTLKQYRQYKANCKEIFDFVKQNFSSKIYSIFRKSLNTLIDFNNQTNVSRQIDRANIIKQKMGKKAFTSSDLLKINAEANIDSGVHEISSVLNLKRILNAANAVNHSNEIIRFKPSEILKRINNEKENDSLAYLLPDFTESGVNVQIKDGKISTKFIAVSKAEGDQLKEYMLSEVDSNSELKNEVNQFFDLSSNALIAALNGNSACFYLCKSLEASSIFLFGDDLNMYKRKGKSSRKEDENLDNAEEMFSDDQYEVSDGDGNIYRLSSEELPKERGVNVSAIQFGKGTTFNTGIGQDKDGNVVIELTPNGDGSFRIEVQCESGKLFVEKTASELLDGAEENLQEREK